MTRIAGIRTHMLWTFFFLLAWLIPAQIAHTENVWTVASGVLFLFAIFGCIVLHELGYTLAAETQHLNALQPRFPPRATGELFASCVGPLVSLLLVVLCYFLSRGAYRLPVAFHFKTDIGLFFTQLMWANLALALFSLLPAFPMDGGRILRSLLALRMRYQRATEIAAGIGQSVACAFAILGLFYNPLLLLIALFIFLGTKQEAYTVWVLSYLTRTSVRDVMVTQFDSLAPSDTLDIASRQLLAGIQLDFPVEENGKMIGFLSRKDLVAGLARNNPDLTVSDIMRHDPVTLTEFEDAEVAWQQCHRADVATIPVIRHGEVMGLVTLKNLLDFVLIKAALHGKPAKRSRIGAFTDLIYAAKRRPAHRTL
jgi:Zn-dependent protease/CBS domain-containing protein